MTKSAFHKLDINTEGHVRILTGTQGGKPLYENVGKLPIVTINFYEQYSKPEKEPKLPPNLKPGELEFKKVWLVELGSKDDRKKSKRLKPEIITVAQFHFLYSAAGATSGWWPLSDKKWNSRAFFKAGDVYILYKGNMPIAFGCIHFDVEPKSGKRINKITYVGIIKSQRNKGFGSYFFDMLNHKAWSDSPDSVKLDTVPELDMMGNCPATVLYEKRGFKKIGSETLNPVKVDPKTLNQFNIPSYYHVSPSHKNQKEFEERLAKAFRVFVKDRRNAKRS